MDTDTPEYFYKQIQEIQTQLDQTTSTTTSDEFKGYDDAVSAIRNNIQTQISTMVNDKPVKSQQMLEDYKEIYDASYMTNFSFFLGICLIFWYIFKSNINSSPNVATSPTPS